MFDVMIDDLEALDRFADRLVMVLPPGVTMALVGTLGAGKTTLVQSIARSLGIDAADVTSPTFTLLQSHAGEHPVHGHLSMHHLDAYRLADEDEFYELGVDELIDQEDAWTVIEWADRVANSLPVESVWIKLRHQGNATRRTITLWSDCDKVAKQMETLQDS